MDGGGRPAAERASRARTGWRSALRALRTAAGALRALRSALRALRFVELFRNGLVVLLGSFQDLSETARRHAKIGVMEASWKIRRQEKIGIVEKLASSKNRRYGTILVMEILRSGNIASWKNRCHGQLCVMEKDYMGKRVVKK